MPPSKVAVADHIANGWTLDTLQVHITALETEREKFYAERDRRYAEVAAEREKAIKIKEKADDAALGLAREIQSYKDEKANQLREQINSERGSLASKDELAAAVRELNVAMAPLTAFVSRQGGEHEGSRASFGRMLSIIVALSGISTIVGAITSVIILFRH